MSMEGYDLIGDVHGCGATLASLLEKLGYHQRNGVYRHPRRKVIFLGDLIDRGPRIRLAVTIARRMVEQGEAYIVMGNHEYNALAYTHPGPAGSHKRWLREHTPRHNRIIQDTLEQYRDYTNEWEDTLAWFKTIPLCLEIDGIRVVHACWDEALIEELKQRRPDYCMDTQFLIESTNSKTQAFRILDRLTRGPHVSLPKGIAIHSGDGFTRQSFRAHFWAQAPQQWGDVVFQPDNLPGDLETRALTHEERQKLSYYGPEQPPLFIGHYWCEGIPALPTHNIACLDYSAVKYGRLVAYRWSGERVLNADHFVWIKVPKEERALPKPWEIDFD
ncbi:Bis(5'-nucleosyl)-tetraphosphatase prpE [Halomonas sp. A3H3]|uniref:Metallo-dependent phosphatase n=2 Tax=Vreelandella titanicae TaxID=664683 RepID=L9UAT1_9GAMM|nr:Metallo-dependent phosphatase [Halomonas titanicae BH1]CDG54730.1 Bis(5'-nucleosyl)-tetraphosphatase prpE [Halomonas sp. A3H3]